MFMPEDAAFCYMLGEKSGLTLDVPLGSRAIISEPDNSEGGRCISATNKGAESGKAMGNCMATGHAAGVAAALSARKGITPPRTESARTSSQTARRRRPVRDHRLRPEVVSAVKRGL